MPATPRGAVYRYDFGPVIGAELSEHRRALIISNDDFNSSQQYEVAIAVPMSGNMPAAVHQGQHIHIAASDSWASAWQIKTVDKGELGDSIGRATLDEMDDVLGELLWRLDRRHAPGEIQTAEGPLEISTGTLWGLTLAAPGRERFQTMVLVIDYNAGNNMAIVVEVAPGEPSPHSPTSAPVTALNNGQIVTARIHRVRSIDASAPERELQPLGLVRAQDVGAVIEKLKTLL